MTRTGYLITSLLVLTVSGSFVLDGCYSKPRPAAGRWVRYASGGRYIGAHPRASPNDKLVVFSSPATGCGDIYVYNMMTGAITRLTDDPNYEGDPAWSHDGKQIVFVRTSFKTWKSVNNVAGELRTSQGERRP